VSGPYFFCTMCGGLIEPKGAFHVAINQRMDGKGGLEQVGFGFDICGGCKKVLIEQLGAKVAKVEK